MPPINHAALASAGAVAVSVAVAAAIAIYESPELRRNIEELRRRVAIALHALGENMDPAQRAPMFNRPEDAQGFYESRRGPGAEPGVDADEESRRRQRDELMYWNAIRLERMSRLGITDAPDGSPASVQEGPQRSKSFDDFMQQDENGDRGSYVVNTGADVRQGENGLRRRPDVSSVDTTDPTKSFDQFLQQDNNGESGAYVVHQREDQIRRRPDGTPLFNSASAYANPFADEHQIDRDELETPPAQPPKRSTQHRDNVSDIYSSTTYDPEEARRILATIAPAAAVGGVAGATAALIDLSPPDDAAPDNATERSETLDRELPEDEYVTAGQDDRAHDEAYASIQAWAQGSSADFYSPLPMSPPSAPMSEPEVISEGMLTPTDSVSLAGSGEDVGRDDDAASSAGASRPYDVLSESEGMMTPAGWSEVGSVISESDSPQRVQAM